MGKFLLFLLETYSNYIKSVIEWIRSEQNFFYFTVTFVLCLLKGRNDLNNGALQSNYKPNLTQNVVEQRPPKVKKKRDLKKGSFSKIVEIRNNIF